MILLVGFTGHILFAFPPAPPLRADGRAKVLSQEGRVCYEKARKDFYRGRLKLASREIECALRLEPRNPAYLFLAGRIYLRLNRPQKALPYLRRGLRFSPPRSSLRYRFIEILLYLALKHHCYDEAKKLIYMAQKEYPDSPISVRFKKAAELNLVVPESVIVNEESPSEGLVVGSKQKGSRDVNIPQFIRLRVAILNFSSSDKNLSKEATSLVYSGLSSEDRYVLLERSQVEALMKEKKLSLTGLTAANYTITGEFEGVDALVLGEVLKDGNEYVVSGRLVEVATSKVLRSCTAKGRTLEEACSQLVASLVLPSFYGEVRQITDGTAVFEIRRGEKPAVGQPVAFVKIKNEIRDEETGELLGVEWEKIAEGEVESVSGDESIKAVAGFSTGVRDPEELKNLVDKSEFFIFSR